MEEDHDFAHFIHRILDNHEKEIQNSKNGNKCLKIPYHKCVASTMQPVVDEIYSRCTEFELNNYILEDYIGKGSFGKVYKVRDKKTGTIYAAKISLKAIEDDSNESLINLSREVNIISKLKHPAILKFIGYSPTNFKGKPKPVIITEFAPNGSLEDLLTENDENQNVFNSTQKLIVIYGIAMSMMFLHSHEILHRDLKPANILMDESFLPKIADFGLSKHNYNSHEDYESNSTDGSIKGTPIYISPEIWNKSEYSKECDVYAFSLILYQIITNKKPFDKMHFYDIINEIQMGNRPELDENVPQCWSQLIQSCWAQEPSDRPSFEEIVEKLKANPEFISDKVDKEKFMNYIKIIDDSNTSYNKLKKINIEQKKKVGQPKSDINKLMNKIESIDPNQVIEEYGMQKIMTIDSSITLCPWRTFIQLNKQCKQLVEKAEKDPQKQFLIAQSFIKGRNHFPYITQIGLNYLKKSIKSGCLDSVVYYCKMLIKGKIIPKDHLKVNKLLDRYLKGKDDYKGVYYLLLGNLMKKEENYSEAKLNYEKSINEENDEAMYEYGRLIINGSIASVDKEEGIKFLQRAITKDNAKAKYKYGTILLKEEEKSNQKKEETNCTGESKQKVEETHHIEELSKKEEGVNYIKESADQGYGKAMYLYSRILRDKNEKKKADIYLKRAAYEGNIEAMLEYGVKNRDSENLDIQTESLNFLKEARDKGNLESLFQHAMLYAEYNLPKNNFVDLNVEDGSKMIKRMQQGFNAIIQSNKLIQAAANAGNVKAMVEFATRAYSRIGMQRNKELAKEYFKMAADRGDVISMRSYAYLILESDDPEDEKEGFKYLKMAADKGEGQSQSYIGYMYDFGVGVNVNKEEAFKYYKMGIDYATHDIILNYAICLAKGEGCPINKEEALKYFKIAADKGNAIAAKQYSRMKRNGDGCQVDKEEALKYIKLAVKKGDNESLNDYASMLKNGEGCEVNKKEAIKMYKQMLANFKKKADEGDISSMNNYAYFVKSGEFCAPNIKEAKIYFKKSIDKGNVASMYNYALLLDDIGEKEESLKYYKMSADHGNSDGTYYYALMKKNGIGCRVDQKEALKYFKISADKGEGYSANKYANMKRKGEGCPVDKEEAFKYYKIALNFFKKLADGGDNSAMDDYAYLVENGYGCDENIEEATLYYKLAINKGNSEAMYNYASMLMRLDKVNESFKYLKMSVDKGYIDAMNAYAKLKREGKKCPVDKAEALKFFKTAADEGQIESMRCYAYMMHDGEAGTVDKKETLKYFKKAADLGDGSSMNSYAYLVEKGDGCLPNREEAKKYYLKAIDESNDDAMWNYVKLRIKESNTQSTQEELIQFLKNIADKGDIGAITTYADFRRKGDWLPVDKGEALK